MYPYEPGISPSSGGIPLGRLVARIVSGLSDATLSIESVGTAALSDNLGRRTEP